MAGTAPSLHAVSDALRRLLDAHRPYPAVVVDRVWTLVDTNAGVGLLTEGCAATLLEPPVNVLRLSLHPDGMAPRIGNLGKWRTHVLERLRRQAEATADAIARRRRRELLEVCLRYAVVDVVIQGLARKAEEEATPLLYGRRRQRSEATPGRHRPRHVRSQTDH